VKANKTQLVLVIGVILLICMVAQLTITANAEPMKNPIVTKQLHGFYGLENLFNSEDSTVKLYKSGGFSIRNYELGVAIFAHPISKTESWKFTVMYDGNVSRFLIENREIQDEEEVEEVTTEHRAEPRSSIGADINRFDVPTDNLRSEERESQIYIKMHKIDLVQLEKEFVPSLQVLNERHEGTEAKIQIQISRGYTTILDVGFITDNMGRLNPQFIMSNGLFESGHCYDMKIIAISGNLTHTLTDDFMIFSTEKYQNSSEATFADTKCN